MQQFGTLTVHLEIQFYDSLRERIAIRRILVCNLPGISLEDAKAEVKKHNVHTPGCICVFTPESIPL